MNQDPTTTDGRPRAAGSLLLSGRLGPQWRTHRMLQPGWILLPLRVFLGLTFIYAALQKLANPDFFNASSPGSVQAQMHDVAASSPLGALVSLTAHAGWFTGLAIALGELAVGVGTLLGLKARVAAVGGALLALSFYLTISWNTTPYYYGADVVFLFAWTPFIMIGAGGVLSLDPPRLPAAERGTDGTVWPATRPTEPAVQRRLLLFVATASAAIAALTALVGRLVGGTTSAPTAPRAPATPVSPMSQSHSPAPQPSSASSPGAAATPAGLTRIATVSDVAIGHAHAFTDPATGDPAWLVRLGPDSFKAFDAICTHAGCPVGYDSPARQFICPCHGGVYDAASGAVISGPPPAPLSPIRVDQAGGTIFVK